MCGVRVKISPSSLLALQPPCGGVPSVLGPDDHCLNDPSYRLLGRHPPCRVEHPYASATVCMRYINMGIAAQRARAWLFGGIPYLWVSHAPVNHGHGYLIGVSLDPSSQGPQALGGTHAAVISLALAATGPSLSFFPYLPSQAPGV